MIKTKIICTIGPAVDDPDVMRQLIAGGVDVARMNFSHGTHEEHLKRLNQFRALCAELGQNIPVLLDTKGPEIRTGSFSSGDIEIIEGQSFTLTTQEIDGDSTRAHVNYKGLPGDLSPKDCILIDDGLVKFEVVSIDGSEINCVALNDGVIGGKKSVNVPGISLNLPALTQKDKDDLLFAIANDYDFIAVSFVRKKDDVTDVRRFVDEHDGGAIRIISKIECREGIDNLDEIILVSDGLMIARGDLGVEIPVEEIPAAQKAMIKRCHYAGKNVITATQMLDSMMRNPRPTRAEVTDIANAIYDGTSAIMLSGETASGKYPVESLRTMKRIAQTTESSIKYWKRFTNHDHSDKTSSVSYAISHATCTTAMDLNASVIVAVTASGHTAREISGFRPACPIVAATTNQKALMQLRLSWGVYPVLVDVVESTDDLFNVAVESARESGMVSDGDIIVVTAGVPVGISGTTNMLKVQMVGNILCHGVGIGTKLAGGPLCVVGHDAEAYAFERGNVLAIDEITDALLPIIRQCTALIVAGNDKDGKAEALAKVLEIPIITGAAGATSLLKPGTVVSVDAASGIIQCIE